MRRNIILFLFFLMNTCFLNAQSVEENAWLVQLKPGISLNNLIEKINIPVQKYVCVDRELSLHKLVFSRNISNGQISDKLRENCLAYQKLNRVTSRGIVPNDPLFAQQKYLQVIRANEVWSKGIYGADRRGDTPVVAIVDSGMDTLHPDLKWNQWINYGEIPFNGIDDDSNGYTDDYRGWNGGDSNARTYTSVTLDGHGTAIAGEIAARGNNDTGIAGMNWNIRIMPLVCYPEQSGGDDVGVIRSMLYAYRMKKLYLQTAGAKGANIVAVNTSIGIDLAFPSDAPVWCALYDSLGSVGIISSGATSNTNVDVDVKGDIPSTCPSNYLVVVSNTDENDNRITSGYGTVSVDMAAPGQNVLSTTLVKFGGTNGPFGQVSGTSFASPLVAGSVALIYQTVCDTFLSLSRSTPDSAARLMRQWILSGTDSLAVLDGKCATEGRLNSLKMWQAMDAWCTSHDPAYSISEPRLNGATLYPNPTEQGMPVELRISSSQNNTRLHIFDAIGREIKCDYHFESGRYLLQTKNLAPGSYFLHLNNPSGVLVKKLLVY